MFSISSIIFLVLLIVMIASRIYLLVIQSFLLKLKAKAIARREREKLMKERYIKRFLTNSEPIGWTINFSLITTSLLSGLLLFSLCQNYKNAFATPFSFTENFILYLICFVILLCTLSFCGGIVYLGFGRNLTTERLVSLTIPVFFISQFLKPLFWILKYFVRISLNLLNIDVKENYDFVDISAHMRSLLHKEKTISPQALKTVENALRMSDLDVSDVLIPRNQIQYLDIQDSPEFNLEKLREGGQTRYPLVNQNLDKCIGIIHIKDIFLYQENIKSLDLSKLKRPLIRFQDNVPLEEALKRLLKNKIHMAIVVDEFGGTLGLLTLENILEELVGNIQDEFDIEDADIQKVSESEYQISALATLHDLEEEIGVKLESEDVSTLGGYITEQLGRIPEKGECLRIENLWIRIDEVSAKRIIMVTLRKDNNP